MSKTRAYIRVAGICKAWITAGEWLRVWWATVSAWWKHLGIRMSRVRPRWKSLGECCMVCVSVRWEHLCIVIITPVTCWEYLRICVPRISSSGEDTVHVLCCGVHLIIVCTSREHLAHVRLGKWDFVQIGFEGRHVNRERRPRLDVIHISHILASWRNIASRSTDVAIVVIHRADHVIVHIYARACGPVVHVHVHICWTEGGEGVGHTNHCTWWFNISQAWLHCTQPWLNCSHARLNTSQAWACAVHAAKRYVKPIAKLSKASHL